MNCPKCKSELKAKYLIPNNTLICGNCESEFILAFDTSTMKDELFECGEKIPDTMSDSSVRVQCSECGEIQSYFKYGDEFFCRYCESDKIKEYYDLNPSEPTIIFHKKYNLEENQK